MDPYQQNQHVQGLIAGMGIFFVFVMLLFFAFMIFCFWRIFTKAGMAGPLSLLVLIPGVGSIVVLCILAFARWNVVPVAPYGALPPSYPPPYPPPPAPPAPPAQL